MAKFGFYFSLDELLSLHEALSIPLQKAFEFDGFLTHAWVVPAAILLVFLIFFFFNFFWSLPTPIKFSILLAGFLYVGGALGMEMISGKYLDLYEKKDFGYEILITIEESLEIFGIVIMINTLLSYLKKCAIDEVNIKFDFSSKKAVEMQRKDLRV